jgi:hypothetical protein
VIVEAARSTVANNVWIILALLHRENPERPDFTGSEILERAAAENLLGSKRTFQTHLSSHCVANREPDKVKHRLIFSTGRGRYRLFRTGDLSDPKRTGKIAPAREELPRHYQDLLDWYEGQYAPKPKDGWLQGMFDMEGAGKGIWADVDIDEYVRQLREDPD